LKLLRTTLLALLLALPVHTVLAAPEVGLPSTTVNDGKFLGLAGVGVQSLTQQSKFFIGLSSTETNFSVSVFDGDIGGLWDNHNAAISVKTEFALYADPNRTGDPTGKTPLVIKSSDQLPDNAWGDVYNGPVHPAARSYSGNYFYFVVVRWSNEAQSALEFNAYKMKATGQLSLTPGQWAFVGAPINLGSDPALNTAGNTYNGSWDWYAYVPPGISQVSFTECDADSRPAGGSPPDDETDARVLIPPDVRFSVFGPNGALVINQPIPSGNTVCKTTSQPVTSGGVYRWNWVGVDAHNLIFVDLAYETFQQPTTPLAVGTPTPAAGTPGPGGTPAAPTATPQPSGSGSGGGQAAATPTPSKTPAPVLTPRVPVAEGTTTPGATTTPFATATAPPVTATVVPPTATAVRAPAAAPTAQAAPQLPRVLPRSGDLAPVAFGLFGLLTLGAGLRFRSRRR
jgi:hypothetical protein